MRLLALFTLLFVATTPFAQDVREKSPRGLETREYQAAAKKAGAHWPNFKEGGRGTQVWLSFDARNADLKVVTERSVGEKKLLAILQELAAQLEMPKADYVTYPTSSSSRAVSADVEMKDHLVFPDRWKTTFQFPIGRAVRFLERQGLPLPIVLAIRADDARFTHRGKEETISEFRFLGATDVDSAATVRFETTLSPWGYVAIFVFAAYFVGFYGFCYWMLLRLKKEAPALPKEEEEAIPRSSEEIQTQYDKAKPAYTIYLSILVPVLGVAVFSLLLRLPGVIKAIESGYFLVPATWHPWILALVVTPTPIAIIAAFFRTRHLRNPEDETPPMANIWPMMAAIGVMLTVYIVTRAWPGFYRLNLPSNWPKILLWTCIGLAVVGTIAIEYKNSRKRKTFLKPGDHWYNVTMRLADRAGVKVRSVVLTKGPEINAYANLFNGVGLTKGLVEKLEPEEVEAIIAHELGHHKQNDVRKGFALSLLFLVGYYYLVFTPIHWLADKYHWDRAIGSLLNGPVAILVLMPLLQSLFLGRHSRNRERRADAFGAWLIGDKELMIRALTKMTHINESPMRLKPADENLSSHPSLVNRIESLRKVELESFDPKTFK